MTRLALFTAVHPATRPYLRSFAQSVLAQTDPDFDLVVALDGIEPAEAEASLGAERHARFVPAIPGDTPASLRQRAMAGLVDSHEAIVFVDADDVLAKERLAAARDGLSRADVYACAMRLIDAGGNDRGAEFEPAPAALETEHLAFRNFVGLSNSAYRSSILRRCLPIPTECVVVDWLLATRAHALGARFEIDAQCRMLYRQHPANVSRIEPPFDEGALRKSVGLVLSHYDLALAGPPRLGAVCERALVAARSRLLSFRDAVLRDGAALHDYLDALNRRPPKVYLWWEWIAHPELESIWNKR